MADRPGRGEQGVSQGAEHPLSRFAFLDLRRSDGKPPVRRGRLLSGQFLQKPSRKIYPDYYNFIQRPIAFDDIRKKLDRNAYPTLEAVREDFELCFTNAKTYNLKGSEIYNDAKDLLVRVPATRLSALLTSVQKLVNKTAARLAGVDPHEKKKDKPPTLHKLLKSRLQKLIDKTDDRCVATYSRSPPR